MLINVLDVLQLPASDDQDDIDAAYTTAVATAIANAKDGDRIYIRAVRPIKAPEAC